MNILGFLLTLVTSAVSIANTAPATYVRFTIADPTPKFQTTLHKSSIFDIYIIDTVARKAYSGDVVTILEPCLKRWKCLELGYFNAAVPESCTKMHLGGSWQYKDNLFNISGIINPSEKNSSKLKLVIEARKQNNNLVSVFIYSQDRGMESFALVDGSTGKDFLIEYYLTSGVGALAGGCVR